MRGVLKLTGIAALVVAVVGAVFLVGMRQKSPVVQTPVKRASRASKARVLRTAGQPGSGTAVVKHVGRTSGQPYETPVAVVATDDGFVVALPYGPTADWVRNVVASGSAVVLVDGDTHDVHEPEVVPMSAIEHVFSPTDQRVHSLFKVDEALRVRRVGTIPA